MSVVGWQEDTHDIERDSIEDLQFGGVDVMLVLALLLPKLAAESAEYLHRLEWQWLVSHMT